MKQLFRRFAAILTAFMLIAGMLGAAMGTDAYAASVMKLSSKSITLKCGKTKTLKLKNPARKVRWKTSNKKIVSIKKVTGKKKNTVTLKAGKKAGKCTITAKVGKKTFKCKVTVKKASKKPATSPEPVVSGSEDPYNRDIDIRNLSSSSVELGKDIEAGADDALPADDEFRKSFDEFAVNILKASVADDSSRGRSVNTLVSPHSILTALAMTENGAEGQTLAEMEKVLSGGIGVDKYNQYLSGLNKRLSSHEDVIYSIADSIWTREGKILMKDDFLRKAKTYYGAEVYSAPFDETTVSDMNKWVYNNTRNMIDNIIDRLDPDDRMVLMNAIAFEGVWQEPFDEPVKMKFTRDDGSKADVSMLTETDKRGYLELGGGRGFVRSYKTGSKDKDGGIAFVGILPPDGVSVDDFAKSLTGDDWMKAWDSRRTELVNIRLPEFSYDYDISLVEPVKGLGMKTAFTDDADFSGMFMPSEDTKALRIDDILHKTHIELDKNGTKAAAVTAVIMKSASAVMDPPQPIEVHLDRPFIYALADTETGLPLFIGIVRDPAA